MANGQFEVYPLPLTVICFTPVLFININTVYLIYFVNTFALTIAACRQQRMLCCWLFSLGELYMTFLLNCKLRGTSAHSHNNLFTIYPWCRTTVLMAEWMASVTVAVRWMADSRRCKNRALWWQLNVTQCQYTGIMLFWFSSDSFGRLSDIRYSLQAFTHRLFHGHF